MSLESGVKMGKATANGITTVIFWRRFTPQKHPPAMAGDLSHLTASCCGSLVFSSCSARSMAFPGCFLDGDSQKWQVSVEGGLEHGFYDFPYIGNSNPNWLSYFSDGLKPPTSFSGSFLALFFSMGSFSLRWFCHGSWYEKKRDPFFSRLDNFRWNIFRRHCSVSPHLFRFRFAAVPSV